MQSEMEAAYLYIPGILVVSFLVSIFAFPSFIKLLESKNLLDKPDHRKLHTRSVPSMGGVIVIISMMITTLFFFPVDQLLEYRYFLGGLIIMFIVGLRDDLVPLRPFLKLLSQLVPIAIVFFFFDIRLESLYSLAEIGFPLWLQVFITAFTMIIITNSFNLVDGIDGLAGSLSLLSIAAFATVFHINGYIFYAYLLLALGGAILGFLVFNWAPARIFIGDNGALFIGFVLSCSAVLFIRQNETANVIYFSGSVGTAIALISVPLYDMFRIIILRLVKRRGLMSADRNHIHHLLEKCGLSHGQVTSVLFTLQAVIIILVLLGTGLSDWLIFLLLAVILSGFNGIVWLISNRKPNTQESGI